MSQISVIVPVYNAQKTLYRCLNSICAQTFKDFEVILINDGSSDKSFEICEEFCSKDSRFRLINQENAGPSRTRNRGIDEAISKYLAFVDADDYIEPDMLEEFYNAAEVSNADMTVCGYISENEISSGKSISRIKPGVYRGDECRRIITESIKIGEGYLPPYSWVRFVRREVMENPRLRFNTKIHRSEDYLLWTQVGFCIDSLCIINNKFLYHYVENDASITHNYVGGYWEMVKELYDELVATLPDEENVRKNLKEMFLSRAYLAMKVASFAKDKNVFRTDLKSILKDKKLRKVVDSIPILYGIKAQKKRYVLLKFRLYPIIMMVHNNRRKKMNLR